MTANQTWAVSLINLRPPTSTTLNHRSAWVLYRVDVLPSFSVMPDPSAMPKMATYCTRTLRKSDTLASNYYTVFVRFIILIRVKSAEILVARLRLVTCQFAMFSHRIVMATESMHLSATRLCVTFTATGRF